MSSLETLRQLRSASAILLDTNLLVISIAAAIDARLVEKLARHRAMAVDDARLASSIFTNARKSVTLPHVLTEASNLLGVLRGEHLQLARAALRNFASRSEEMLLESLSVMSDDYRFRRLGLTDAAIFRLATENVLVVSDDAALCAAIYERTGWVVNFNHLRSFDQ